MTSPKQAIRNLIVLSSVRYAHMDTVEKRQFLEAVMIVGGEPEAGAAAMALAAIDESDARQLEFINALQAPPPDGGDGVTG